MPAIVDVKFSGIDRAVGAWLTDGLVVDPGPATGLEHVLDALGEGDLRAILLTHIHLDHAGAAGALAERFPQVKVYVHEIGAPHIADPARLVASSRRVFGGRFEAMGEPIPVPEERLVPIREGDRVEGLDVIHAPGHASNHVCYLDEESGDAYVGDVTGVSIEGGTGVVMPTPPPEIDLDAWDASLVKLADRSPERLRLTHFGTIGEPDPHIERCRELLRVYADLARAGERDPFDETLAAEAADRDEARTLEAVVTGDDAWAGLERWASKQARPR